MHFSTPLTQILNKGYTMTFSKFVRGMGAVVAVMAHAAAEAQVQQTNQRTAMSGELMECQRWETRRLEALANIEDGLKRDTGTVWMNGLTSKQQKAIDLRAEVNTHCRNRSDSMMRYTEERIRSFQKSSW
jgi:hypothetical protein